MLHLEQLEDRLCPSAADIFSMTAPVYNHGGPTLSNPAIYNVYAAGAPNMDGLTQVMVGDYGAVIKSVYGIGTGTFAGSTTLPDPGPLSSTQISVWLQNALNTGAVPKGYTYMVYLNTGATDLPGDGGYHTYLAGPFANVPYAVEWQGTDAYVPTHEYAEMVTDPFLSGYFADPSPSGGEIGDLAFPGQTSLDGYMVAQLAAPNGYVPPPQPQPPGLIDYLSIPSEEFAVRVWQLWDHFFPQYFASQYQAAVARLDSNPALNTPLGQQMQSVGDSFFISALSH